MSGPAPPYAGRPSGRHPANYLSSLSVNINERFRRCRLSTEAVQQKFAELDALNRQMRHWKIGASIACAVIIITGVMVLRGAAVKLVNKGPQQEQFIAELSSGMQRDVVPVVTTLTMSTLDKLVPSVKTELAKLEARTPELSQKLLQELDLLGKEMPVRINQTLEATMGQVIRDREVKIRAMFPEVTEQTVGLMVKHLSGESQKRLNNIGQDIMNPYADAIQGIFADANQIRELERDAIKDVTVTWEVAVLCANLLHENLKATVPVEYARFVKETSLLKETR